MAIMLGPKTIVVNTCEVCGKPVQVIKFIGGKEKGMFWVCENGHKRRTRKYRTEIKK